jgi:hypothetical protein
MPTASQKNWFEPMSDAMFLKCAVGGTHPGKLLVAGIVVCHIHARKCCSDATIELELPKKI